MADHVRAWVDADLADQLIALGIGRMDDNSGTLYASTAVPAGVYVVKEGQVAYRTQREAEMALLEQLAILLPRWDGENRRMVALQLLAALSATDTGRIGE